MRRKKRERGGRERREEEEERDKRTERREGRQKMGKKEGKGERKAAIQTTGIHHLSSFPPSFLPPPSVRLSFFQLLPQFPFPPS
jgi:hypothetical protein